MKRYLYNSLKKSLLTVIGMVLFIGVSWGQVTIFTETMYTGSGGVSGDLITTHETNNRFDNDGYTMSGSGDMRTTTASSGYTGASGTWNVYLTNTLGKDFQIADISTVGYTSLSISFGAYKSTTASNMTEMVLEYSTDGTIYNVVSFPAEPTGAGTAVWRLISGVSLPIGSENQSNLRLRWRQTSATPQFRIDDIVLKGTIAAIKAEPTNFPSAFTCGVTTSLSIPLSWTDAGGAVAPDGYLIKWSSTSYAAITAPVDGTPVANGAGVRNVAQGIGSYNVTGLSSSATYYFKIWSYTNSGVNINYKTVGEPQTSCATIVAPVYCGTETFTNSNAPSNGSYASSSFVGDNSVTWTYVESRDENGDANSSGIVGKALMLRDLASLSKVTSSSVAGGIADFTVTLYKGFTGAGNRQVELFINGVSKGTSTVFNDYSPHIFTVTGINIAGNVIIEITNKTANQVIVDDISWTCYNPNSITTGAVTVTPFAVNCGTTAAGTVAFTSVGTYVGNTYTAQLSNATGSFTSPINIGTLVSNANSGTINVTIPANSTTGTLYQIRVVSNSPAITGVSSAAFTINNGTPCVITPGAITGSPFNVTCAASAAGTIAFTSTATYVGNTYTAQLSNAAGSFISPTDIGTLVSNANSGTISITIPAGTIAGAGYLIRIISNSPVVIGSSSGAITINNASPCVITPNILSGSPFSVSCIAGVVGTLTFTSNAAYSGNTYTAQLSDVTGSFASPTNVGTLVSNANSGTINVAIPAGTVSGAGYLIRIISNSPHVIGSSIAATVNLTGGPCTSGFEIVSILVDACGGGSNPEGANEMVRFQIGPNSLNTSALTITWPSNSYLGICQNSTTASIVAAINSTITGGGIILEPVGGVLPAGAQVMLFTSTAFAYTLFDFTALNYTIYAIFQCPGNTQGHFVNYNSTDPTWRTLTMTFAGSPSVSDTVTYNAHLLYNGDGAAVQFDAPGNPTYGSAGSGCQAPIFPLPIELISFNGIYQNKGVKLFWKTASETNNNYFEILKSKDLNYFEKLGIVVGAGNTNNISSYEYFDTNPFNGNNYYKLKQVDFDGQSSESNIIVVQVKNNNNINIYSANNVLYVSTNNNENVDFIEITDITGKTIYSTKSNYDRLNLQINVENFAKGIYFAKVLSNNQVEVRKFIVQ